jgi:hypothetical protein
VHGNEEKRLPVQKKNARLFRERKEVEKWTYFMV